MRRVLRLLSMVAAISLLTMGSAHATDEEVPAELREQAPQLLDDAMDSILADEGSDEFNLDGREGIEYGELHRLHRLGGTPEDPRLVTIDEWLVPVFQDGEPRLRIILWVDGDGYAFGDAAASDDMSYLTTLGDRQRHEKLVLLPVSNSLFLTDPATGQVREVTHDSGGEAVRTLQELAELDAEELTPVGGEDADEDTGTGVASQDDDGVGLSPGVMVGVAGLILAGGAAVVVLRRRARAA